MKPPADELAARVRALNAERMRPDPPSEPTVEELMQRLIASLNLLWHTPTDKERLAAMRRESGAA